MSTPRPASRAVYGSGTPTKATPLKAVFDAEVAIDVKFDSVPLSVLVNALVSVYDQSVLALPVM